jgi:hypothetical protein
MSGEIVSSSQVYDEAYNAVAIRVVRELPDGTRTESIEPLAKPERELPESPADRIWR